MPDRRTCSHCTSAAPDTRLKRARQARTARESKKTRRDSFLRWEFSSDCRRLLLEADLSNGWRFLKKVWGYCEEVGADALADRAVRIQVKVLPRFGGVVSEAPRFADEALRSDESVLVWRAPAQGDEAESARGSKGLRIIQRRRPIYFQLQQNLLRLHVELVGDDDRFNPALAWGETRQGAPRVHWIHERLSDCIMSPDGYPSGAPVGCFDGYQLQVLIVAKPAPLRPPPISRAWLQRFFVPGGLPSLGKKQ